MGETVFTKVDYDLISLVKYIDLGELALPDIQRPFVWKNTKVRDLFDSMYRGYPVGYLLFWKNALPAPRRTIGDEEKQKSARLLIVDGQQRLTSLYAVIKSAPVRRSNYQQETIRIAFNPLEERFEVAGAAIRRNKAYIPDISVLWQENTKITRVIFDYIEQLKKSRHISDLDESDIEDRILKLQSLQVFPFTALELDSDIDEEAVADVFVRINSKGTSLNQAHFILTLMSVFWDEGRKELEQFCRQCRQPTTNEASPFNYFFEPSPDQLLRVCVGVGFKRARLKHVYSILRGKDLETEKFSDERREQQFDLLRKSQELTLNPTYWHEFLKCIWDAGFRSSKMISSQNNLLFSYILYLIGRTEYGVSPSDLNRTISRWFFMSAVTSRFTSSPESDMEFDLARLRGITTADAFVDTLNHLCDITLTNDFWTLTLPNDLATSAPRSPSFYAYQAALVLLDAQALSSKSKVSDLLDPSHRNKNAIQRQHLFPKSYLKMQGITSTREINQIANFGVAQRSDDTSVSEAEPGDGLPLMRKHVKPEEIERMYKWHALPPNWEQMPYQEFLERRREIIARIVHEAYNKLITGCQPQPNGLDLFEVLHTGESESIEFKSSLRTSLHTHKKDSAIELAVLKTLAAFLNTDGGTLLIGVADDGSPVGIEVDSFPNEDKASLHLINIVKARINPHVATCLHIHFQDFIDKRVMIVECKRAATPTFVKDGAAERFYVRTGPSTSELTPTQTKEYVKQRFSQSIHN